MIVLGIDQSTKLTGWCVLKDGSVAGFGVIKETTTTSVADRCKNMFLDIVSLIERVHPDMLIAEGVQSQASAKTMLMLSQLGGMIIGYAYTHNIPVAMYLPVEWRRVLQFRQGPKVKRPELKEQSLAYVKDFFNLEMSEDAAEACCIAQAAWQIIRGGATDGNQRQDK